MPIPLDTHDPEVGLTPGTTKSDIVAFLYSNTEFGYKPAEISTQLNIPPGTATTTLKRLFDAEFVGKTEDSYYHALEGQESLRRYVASLEQLNRMYSHPSNEAPPADQNPETEPVNEDALDAELVDLEDDLEG